MVHMKERNCDEGGLVQKTISVAELKRRLSEVLGEVAHGKHAVLVTRRGRPAARLLPVEPGPTHLG